MIVQSGVTSFCTKIVRLADCVSEAIVSGTVTFARIVSSWCAFGIRLAPGAVYVKVAWPLLSVAAEDGVMLPRSSVGSMWTVTPESGVPALSTRLAVTVAVPVGAMTGVGVDRESRAMGAGGPTVISSCLEVDPVEE